MTCSQRDVNVLNNVHAFVTKIAACGGYEPWKMSAVKMTLISVRTAESFRRAFGKGGAHGKGNMFPLMSFPRQMISPSVLIPVFLRCHKMFGAVTGSSASVHRTHSQQRVDVGGLSSQSDDAAGLTWSFVHDVKPSTIRMPWENDLFHPIFGAESMKPVSLGMPLDWGIDPNLVEQEVHTDSVLAPPPFEHWVVAKCIKNLKDETFQQSRDRTMKYALSKLDFLLRLKPRASRVGSQIIADPQDTDQILLAVIGAKSPNTVVKRANAMLSFFPMVFLEPVR